VYKKGATRKVSRLNQHTVHTYTHITHTHTATFVYEKDKGNKGRASKVCNHTTVEILNQKKKTKIVLTHAIEKRHTVLK